MLLTSEINPDPIEDIILKALKQGDKNRGQLFDLAGKNYPTLVQALQRLQFKGLIDIHFVPKGGISVLTYHLRADDAIG